MRFVLTDGDGGGSGNHDTTVTVSAVNDTPVVTSASLTLSEGQTVTLSGANFGITDPDSASFTYTVSAVTGGYFQLSTAPGTPITTFTSADLAANLVQFVDDGNEVAPSFSVTVNDGSVDSNTLAASITYTPVNDTPVVTSASLTLSEGQTVTLSGANFGITDPDSASFTYTVSAVTGGYFQLSTAPGTPITTFTSADLAGNLVQFVDDGNEVAPSFSVTVNDGSVDSNTLAASITYTPVNDTPVIANLAGDTLAYAEGDGAVVIEQGGNATVSDVDSVDFNTGTLTVSFTAGSDSAEDVLAIRNQGTGAGQIGVSGSNVTYGGVTIGSFAGGSGGADLVVTFNASSTAAAAQALIRNITFQDTDTNAPTTGARTVRFVLTDGDGGGSGNHDTTVTVSAVNDTPVVTSASLTLSEGQTVTLSGANFGITDPDSASFTYTVSAVTGGYFQLSTAPGTPITTFTSADLAGNLVQFVDDGNEVAPSFNVTVNDGSVDSNTLAASITYTPVNDTPVIANLAGDTLAYAEGDGAVVIEQGGNATVSDVDSVDFNTGTLTVSFTAGSDSAEDVLAIRNQGTGAGQIGVSGSNVTYGGVTIGSFAGGSGGADLVVTFNASSTAAAAQALIRNITFQDTDTNAPTTGARTVRFVLTDGDGGGSGNHDTTVTVSAVNDTPVVTSASLTLSEGQTVTLSGANFGITDPDSPSFTYTVSAVTGGYFQLSTAPGTPITTFTSADLAGNLVQFVDDGNEVAPSFSVTVNDGSVNSNTLAASITYTPVNDTPVVTSASLTLSEGQTVTLSGANFGITDPDSASFTYTVSAVTGGYFQLSTAPGTPITTFTSADLAGNLVQFVDDGNEVAPSFSVTVNDGSVDSNTLAASITYTPVNDTPVIANLAGDTLAYAEGDGAVVIEQGGNATVSDVNSVDFNTGTLTVSFTAGSDSAEDVLAIRNQGTGAGQIGVSGSNVTYGGVTIGSFAGGSGGADLVVTFNASSTAAAAQALIRNITFQDTDTNAPTTGARTVRFVLTDGDGGGSGNHDTTVTVSAVNDTPVVTSASLTLSEGQTVTLSGANFGITDPDSASFTYTVSAVTGGYFQLSTAPGTPITTFTSADLAGNLVQFVDDGNEVAPSFNVTVNDGSVDSNTLAASITYTPVNDTPVVTSDGGGASVFISIAENTGYVTTATAIDADLPAQLLTFSINGGADAAHFLINSTTGVLNFVAAQNREAPTDANSDSIYEVSIQVSDGTLTGIQTISVTVTDVNEFAVGVMSDSNITANAVAEKAATGTAVGITASATDADATTNTITYSLDDNAGGRFAINAVTGVVTVADGTLLDRQAAASHNIIVRATSADGSFSTQLFTINLTAGAGTVNITPPPPPPPGPAEPPSTVPGSGGSPTDPSDFGGSAPPGSTDPGLVPNDPGSPNPDPSREPAASPVTPDVSGRQDRPAVTNVPAPPAAEPLCGAMSDVGGGPCDLSLANLNRTALENAMDRELSHVRVPDAVVAQILGGTSVVLSAGFVAWILRGGALASALLASMPMWRGFDPLPVLMGRRRKDEKDEPTTKADRIFDRTPEAQDPVHRISL